MQRSSRMKICGIFLTQNTLSKQLPLDTQMGQSAIIEIIFFIGKNVTNIHKFVECFQKDYTLCKHNKRCIYRVSVNPSEKKKKTEFCGRSHKKSKRANLSAMLILLIINQCNVHITLKVMPPTYSHGNHNDTFGQNTFSAPYIFFPESPSLVTHFCKQ